MSLCFALYQYANGAGIGIGTWFLPLYFFMLFAVTYARPYLEKILRKFYKPLIRVFYIGMALFCAAFISVCVYIMTYSEYYIYDDPDLVIVLGAQTIGYNPSRILATRLDEAIKVLERHPSSLAITAGGQGPDAIATEARIMRMYLMRHGDIAEERIIEEGRSSDTFENLLFSREIIERYTISNGRVVIVTSEFHIPRAMMLARRVFCDNTHFYAVKSDSPFALFSAGITREFFAFVKSFLFDRE